MGVAFGIVRESKVNHVRQVLNVDSAGRYVGTHEEFHALVAERLHDQVTLLLAQVAVECRSRVAFGHKALGEFLGFDFGTAKNHTVEPGRTVK